MKRLLSCALLGSSLFLGGCVLSPGSDMPYEKSGPPIDDLVDVQPITFGLVQAQNAARKEFISQQSLKEATQEMTSDTSDYNYRIGKGDILNIVVYDHPELTIPAGGERSSVETGNVVHSDGTIFYPYVGRIHVAGKNVADVRAQIASSLADYIAEPQVEVNIASFQSQKVYVSGQVSNPGQQPITNTPLTVLDAITSAGGLNENADWRHVVLTHKNGQEEIINVYDMLQNGQMSQNRLLNDGDVLHVPDVGSQKVYVLGEVLRPQDLPMGGHRFSLVDALSQSGGIDEVEAQASGIFVIRQGGPGDKMATVYQLDASNAASFVIGTEFELEPQDIVYVTTAPISRWNRVISQLLPTTNLTRSSVGSVNDYNDL
ncbi:polysaccharide export protein [Kushneria konosiri]|uniref:Polysaccharide export protein Wza n=1 Tax=Kushneria konosiri TaxID=698828 RepID=A0A2Z2H9H4_9GAMM|nr:polysaccharide export protein [Kushneria konosiri]ARS54112.1 polysaccharide export protein Wza [Kushneria konosiri]